MQLGVPLGRGQGGKTCGQGDGQSPAQGVGNTWAPPGEGRGPEAMSWGLEDAHNAICSLGTPSLLFSPLPRLWSSHQETLWLPAFSVP